MQFFKRMRQKARWTAAVGVALLIISGCTGIRPYEPRNHREEGPEKGMYTGSDGEFVIYRIDKSEAVQEPSKASNKTGDRAEACKQP